MKMPPTKPHFYGIEPEPINTIRKTLKVISLFDCERVEIPALESGQYYCFETDHHSDNSDEYYLKICQDEKVENVNYEKEITEYNKLKADYDKRMKVYNTAMDAYRAEQLKELDKKELAEYERLKSKFGPK